jgi:DhnA family fructose-bisphosphate aldolase class Ia
MDGITIRLNRLFPDGKPTVIVAIDHGQTFGPLQGIEDFTAATAKLSEADGVLMAPHMIRFSGNLFLGRNRPVVIARLNWNTIHCYPWDYREGWATQAISPATAVALGADVLLASLVLQTGDEAHDAENVGMFAQLAEECHRLGIPLIGEVFPAGGAEAEHDLERLHPYIKITCRIAAELGADAIKTFYTGARFPEVVEGCPIPIFCLGAEKLESELDALKLAQREIAAGARGVVFGRNVIQARDPAKFLQALKAVVQEESTPKDAADRFGLY